MAEICLRLDGLPLAIELAAARMRMMTATELAQRLDDSRLLVGGPRTAQPRHQSLTAAIDWSYRLLAPDEQQLFARMSVFAGGADLAAVHGVCAEPGSTDVEVLALLTAARSTSRWWPRRPPRPAPATGCWRRCAPTAGTACARAGDDVALARPARPLLHRTGRTGRARASRAPTSGSGSNATLPDRDNLRVAFEQAFADRDGELALRLVTSLTEVLLPAASATSPAVWAERALDIAPAGPSAVRGRRRGGRAGAWSPR